MNETAPVTLTPDEAIELGEMLEFIADWLTDAPGAIAESLHRFGSETYGVGDLRAELLRFAFLLGTSPERLFEDRT